MAGQAAAAVPAMGEGLAAHLMLRIFDLPVRVRTQTGRKHEVCGPGEPGPGVPLLLNEQAGS